MRALILAAGMGKRLRRDDGPKALARLLGLPLISRVILTARQAGVREFVIVVGFGAEAVMEALGDGGDLGVKIIYVENEEWERGNGVSALSAEEALGEERFLLLMADHVLEPEVIARVTRTRFSGSSMAVDIEPEEETLPEASKVLLEDSQIVGVGKILSEYSGVDMGVMVCVGDLFRALRTTIKRGQEELDDAFDVLAQEGKLRAVKFKRPTWFDIDTPDDMRRAEKALLRDLVKPEDGPVSRYFNRRISTWISSKLVRTGMTPTQMSALVFALALAAAYLLYLGSYPYLLLGGILVQFSSILDGCDGEIARLKFRATRRGGWIDSVADRYADFAIIMALAYGQWVVGFDVKWWIIAVFALVGSLGVSYTSAAFTSAFGSKHPLRGQLPAKRDSRLLILAVAAALGLPLYGLIVVGLLGNAEVVRRLLTWA